MKLKSFEEVDPTGKKLVFRAGEARRDPIAVAQKVCTIWMIAGPYLKLITNVPILPPKWRNTIKKFSDLMDSLCVGSLGSGL